MIVPGRADERQPALEIGRCRVLPIDEDGHRAEALEGALQMRVVQGEHRLPRHMLDRHKLAAGKEIDRPQDFAPRLQGAFS